MRIHALELEAFGPFPDRVALDLDALSADGVFLIAGPTGAGKTTLLDAICFGLYGRVPGARNDAQALRSQFADPAARTAVTVEFSARGRRYRVERSPAYERPAKRGGGTTLQRASAQLWVCEDEQWAGRARTMAEVSDIVYDAVGLSAEQFTKIIMLPQGDFAAFLRADPQEREPILERLFGTERFATAARELGAAATRARGRIDNVSQERLRLIAQAAKLAAAAGPVPPDMGERAPENPSAAAVDAALSVALTVAREDDETAQASARLAAADEDAARAGAEAIAERLRLRERVDRAGRLRAAADERRTGDAEARGVLDRLRAARAAEPARQEATRARRAAAEAAQRSAEAQAALTTAAGRAELRGLTAGRPEWAPPPTAGSRTDAGARAAADPAPTAEGPPPSSAATPPAVPSAADAPAVSTAHRDPAAHRDPVQHDDPAEHRDPAETLEAGSAAAARLTQARTVLAAASTAAELLGAREDLTGALTAALEREEHAAAAQRAAEEELETLGARRAQAAQRSAAAADPATAETAVEDAGRRLGAARGADSDVEDSAARAARAEAEAAEAARAARTAEEEYRRIRALRLDGIAAELAERLETGAPCPVCGAAEHPHPAPSADDRVTRADEDAAREREATAARRERETAARLAEARSALAAARAARAAFAIDDLDAEAARLRAERERTQALRAEHRAALDADTAAAARLEEGTAAARTAGERAAQAQRAVATARGRLEALADTGLAAALDELDAAGLTPPEDAQQARGLAAAARELESAAAAAERAAAAAAARAEEERERSAAFAAALAASPFADEEGLATALRTDEDALEARLRESEAIAAQLAGIEAEDWYPRAAADAAPSAELEGLRTAAQDALREATVRREAAERRRAVAAHAVGTAEQARERFRAEAAAQEAELSELRCDVELASLVQATSADNAERLPLSAFALLRLFAKVADNASERLARMAGGRYRLLHDTGRHRRERRAGLGLLVFDSFTQETRDPRTLSGGESFMVALALALGLADAVAEAAGGLELDTLFIDEGFGSLDPDALADVLGLLEELQDGGRRIGIISHVGALHQTIRSRVEVIAGPTGSRIARRSAPAASRDDREG